MVQGRWPALSGDPGDRCSPRPPRSTAALQPPEPIGHIHSVESLAAGTGIGRAIAERLISFGVTAHHWDARPMSRPGMQAAVVDVTDPAQVASALGAVMSRHGPVDVPINNVGYGGVLRPFEAEAPTDWRRTIQVDLTGLRAVARAVCP
jgi:NAD(P)-dependent dehydrogenase (short-subunit alcohol dehydrogenase family)